MQSSACPISLLLPLTGGRIRAVAPWVALTNCRLGTNRYLNSAEAPQNFSDLKMPIITAITTRFYWVGSSCRPHDFILNPLVLNLDTRLAGSSSSETLQESWSMSLAGYTRPCTRLLHSILRAKCHQYMVMLMLGLPRGQAQHINALMVSISAVTPT